MGIITLTTKCECGLFAKFTIKTEKQNVVAATHWEDDCKGCHNNLLKITQYYESPVTPWEGIIYPDGSALRLL